ncbi:MAG: hypothetical protein IT426_15830 [Pirellulales bacterium]|nr:hypothetical protein [Pirellulales bacterium]
MPRILPTFAAIAIVGACIAFNTMQYPIVWEMVGPGGQAARSEKNAPAAEVVSSAKAASSVSADRNPLPPNASPEFDPSSTAKESEKPAVPQAIPISMPKEEPATADAPGDAEQAAKAEHEKAPAEDENLVEPPRRLVPVAADAISAGALSIGLDEIRRLPPVEAQPASPADRYAAEYPPAAIPIYPSTGK